MILPSLVSSVTSFVRRTGVFLTMLNMMINSTHPTTEIKRWFGKLHEN